jgi:hypothetical protein
VGDVDDDRDIGCQTVRRRSGAVEPDLLLDDAAATSPAAPPASATIRAASRAMKAPSRLFIAREM